MPILTLQRRLREAGRIRIGHQVATKNGKTRPAKLETFRLTSTDRDVIDAAAQLYGGDAHEWDGAPTGTGYEVFTEADTLPVVIPPAASAFSQYYELWSGGGCVRRCDGERELITDSPCVCVAEDEQQCKPTTRLSVILKDLPGLGVWRLESHGWYAASELAGTVEVCMQAATRGLLLPAILRLEQRQVRRAGEARRDFAVPVLDIQVTPSALGLVAGNATPELGAGSWQALPAAPDDEPASVSAAITAGGRDEPAKRRNSPPDLPATGVRPRGTKPSDAQTKKAMACFNDLGIKDRDDRLAATSAYVGREVSSWSDLSSAEAAKVIDHLESQLDAQGEQPPPLPEESF